MTVVRCTDCPPASYGPIWTDEYAAAGGEEGCDHPDKCCWDSRGGCVVYEHFESHGMDCSCAYHMLVLEEWAKWSEENL